MSKLKEKYAGGSLISKKQLGLETGMWLPVVREMSESVAIGLENVWYDYDFPGRLWWTSENMPPTGIQGGQHSLLNPKSLK